MSKGQSAMEFLALVSMSSLMLAALYGVVASKQVDAVNYQNSRTAERVVEHVSFQVEMAMVQGDGYSRVFSVPEKIGGYDYEVKLTDGSSYLGWGNESVIRTVRYSGNGINMTVNNTNTFKVTNREGEVSVVEQ